MKKIKLLNVQFDVAHMSEIISRILGVLSTKHNEGGRQIVTPNPEMLLHAQEDEHFRRVLNHAWMSVPDGAGVLWASTFLHITKQSGQFMRIIKGFTSLLSLIFLPKYCTKILPARITGTDLMQAICDHGRSHGLRVFLLGAAPGVAEKTQTVLEKKYPGLQIVGTYSGSPHPGDRTEITHLINKAEPNVLFVAYGAPAQEMWINKVLPELKTVRIAMGIGGAFDFISGVRKRAPKIFQRTGIEWLYRLIQEPSRIKRIWNATIKFPFTVIRSASRN